MDSIFAAVFGLVFGVFYQFVSYFITVLALPIVLTFLELFNTVFTFAAASAIAAKIHCHSCKNQSYLDGNGLIQGSSDRCRKAQADVAFLYFTFFIFLAGLVLSLLTLLKNGGFSTTPKRTTPAKGINSA